VTHQKCVTINYNYGFKKNKVQVLIKNTRLNAKFAHDNLFRFKLLFTE